MKQGKSHVRTVGSDVTAAGSNNSRQRACVSGSISRSNIDRDVVPGQEERRETRGRSKCAEPGWDHRAACAMLQLRLSITRERLSGPKWAV